MNFSLLPACRREVHCGGDEDERIQYGNCHEEAKETAVVPLADAIPYPWAVVVKPLNAVVADGAMRASRWSVYVTSNTPLQLRQPTCEQNLHVLWRWLGAVGL
eukprot:1081412-Amphidinium_carterae.1